MTGTGIKGKIWDGARWLLIYTGTYLLGPFLASLFYWQFAYFFPGLLEVEQHQIFYFILAMLIQTLAAFLLVYVLALKPMHKTWNAIGFSRPKLAHVVLYGVAGGLILFLGIILFSALLTYLNPDMQPQYFEEVLRQAKNPFQIGLLFICGSFLAPMIEEMLFRGLLYRGLRQYFAVLPAICLAGLAFGIVHFDFWRTLPLAFGGMALCWMYEKTSCIWVTMTAHGLWNAIMMSTIF